MKRTAFDERRDAAVANNFLENHYACRVCKGMTHRDELSAFGAQCKPCFDAYCTELNTDQGRLTQQQQLALVQRIGHLQEELAARRLPKRSGQGELPYEAPAQRNEALQRRVQAYAEKHGLSLEVGLPGAVA